MQCEVCDHLTPLGQIRLAKTKIKIVDLRIFLKINKKRFCARENELVAGFVLQQSGSLLVLTTQRNMSD